MRYALFIAVVLLLSCTNNNALVESENTPPLVTLPEDVTTAVNALLPQPNLPQLQQAVKWEDASGQNWLLLYQSGSFVATAGTETAALVAELYIKTDSGFKQQWSFSDRVPNCRSGAVMRFYAGHLSVADTDGNGYAEITLVYEQGCAAASTNKKKLVWYEQGRQLQYAGAASAYELPQLTTDTPALQPAIYKHLQGWWQRFPGPVQ